MKVKDLMKILRGLDKNREVVLQRDPEGNGYAELYQCWTGAYSERYGEAGIEKLTDEDRKAGYSDSDVMKGAPAVILVPIR